MRFEADADKTRFDVYFAENIAAALNAAAQARQLSAAEVLALLAARFRLEIIPEATQ